MSWFGKMVGGTVGLMIGGPLGAIAGAAVGHHLFDKRRKDGGRIEDRRGTGSGSTAGSNFRTGMGTGGNRASGGYSTTGGYTGGYTGKGHAGSSAEERQATFFLALFSILGKLAKADGTVTKEEGDQLLQYLNQMNLAGPERDFAVKVFNEAKNSSFSIQEFARQFSDATAGQPHLRSSLMDMVFRIAMADGNLHPAEESMIGTVGRVLGYSSVDLENFKKQYIGSQEQAYAVLGVSPDTPTEEVRATYRRLVQEYHPDTVIGQGMPQEFVEYATKRFQEVQNAWDTIKRSRGEA